MIFFPDPFLACPLPRLEPSQRRSVEDHVTWKRLKHLERSHPSTQVLHIALVSSRLVLYGLLSCSRPHLQMNIHLKSSTTCPRQKEYTKKAMGNGPWKARLCNHLSPTFATANCHEALPIGPKVPRRVDCGLSDLELFKV